MSRTAFDEFVADAAPSACSIAKLTSIHISDASALQTQPYAFDLARLGV
jgi:hypothetical protein